MCLHLNQFQSCKRHDGNVLAYKLRWKEVKCPDHMSCGRYADKHPQAELHNCCNNAHTSGATPGSDGPAMMWVQTCWWTPNHFLKDLPELQKVQNNVFRKQQGHWSTLFWKVDGETDTDRQTGRHRQPHRPITAWLTHTDRAAEGETDSNTDADRQTDRLTDRESHLCTWLAAFQQTERSAESEQNRLTQN